MARPAGAAEQMGRSASSCRLFSRRVGGGGAPRARLRPLMPPPSRMPRPSSAGPHAGTLGAYPGDAVARRRRFRAGRGRGHRVRRLLRHFATVRRLLDPTLQALRAIPSIAWVPLFILWLGIFEVSKVALIAVGVFFPVYLGVAGAILSVDRKLVEVGPRLPALAGGAGAPHPPARRAAPRRDRVALRPGARLHVRGRGRVHGRVRGPRLPARRRTAARQAGPDPGRHHRLRPPGQGRGQRARRADGPLVRWQDVPRERL